MTDALTKQKKLLQAVAEHVLDPATIASDAAAADTARSAMLATKFAEVPNDVSAITDGASQVGF